jgi:hypothetical protein
LTGAGDGDPGDSTGNLASRNVARRRLVRSTMLRA